MKSEVGGFEINFDGLVGPTHNYAGLSKGNVASTNNAKDLSKPKEAAKQGLAKAKSLSELGIKQGILAPHARPAFEVLRRIGFSGTDAQIIEKAGKQCPEILAACYSASAMWTANAATISPSADTKDGLVHITPANLNNKFHRSIEPDLTSRILKATFQDESIFKHHSHLPEVAHFGDEGAANHTRFCSSYDQAGVELFVYGRVGFDSSKPAPKFYPARQTLEASMAVARLHGLDTERVIYAQQNPDVIDQGVFHNDVISVGNQNLYFYHQQALLNTEQVLEEISSKYSGEFHFVCVPTEKVSVHNAVTSYLFNSQLIDLGNKKMGLVVPEECRANAKVWSYLQSLESDNNPIDKILVFNVTESMKNGGGPACLRLRLALKQNEFAAINASTILNEKLFSELNNWIEKHYRDQIHPDDLKDPALAEETKRALDELTQIMNLGSIYEFQKQ